MSTAGTVQSAMAPSYLCGELRFELLKFFTKSTPTRKAKALACLVRIIDTIDRLKHCPPHLRVEGGILWEIAPYDGRGVTDELFAVVR